jgi:hypothetical protein
MALHDKYADLKDRFEILALHESGVKTFEDLDAKTKQAKLVERWGRTLPFPVLLDATGETQEAFGIEAFPTTVLLDPEGRVVKGGNAQALEERLEEIRKGSAPETPQGRD